MPLEGLRWSRDSGSALCDTPQNSRSRTGWWGCVLLISCIFILFLLKKSRNRKVFWYFCHVWILCGITLGILNIVFLKYDAYTSIYLGIICSCYTYYDNKQNPVSKRTNAYISSLQGYVAGIGFLLYGLLSL